MGIKRWLLALLILAVVLVFIFFFFIQSGADKKIAEVVIPRIEEKFGILVTYESVSVSLTSVSFENVRIAPADKSKSLLPFAMVDRLGVNFRVGPLLLGRMDITGVRVDGVHVTAGKGAKGADISKWQALQKAIEQKKSPATESGPLKADASSLKDLNIPEVYIVSGDLMFDDGRFSGFLEEFSGRITPGNKAVLQTRKWGIGDTAHNASIKGERLEMDYDFGLNHLSVDVDTPGFILPSDRERLKTLATNLKGSLDELGMLNNVEAPPPLPDIKDSETPPYLDVVVKISGARGELMSADAKPLMEIHTVNVELLTGVKMLLSARASGGMSGTDARWALQGNIPRAGAPSLVLEVPDLPLRHLGKLIYDGSHIDWSAASADGQLKLEWQDTAKSFLLEGQTSLAGLRLQHEGIAASPIENLRAILEYKLTYDTSADVLKLERLQISRDLARVILRGNVNMERLAFDLEANVPSTSCRQIFEAIPKPLREELEGVILEGHLGMDMHLAFDVLNPDAMILDVNLDNRCKISRFGSILQPDDLRRPFAYMAYDEDGKRMRLTTGPGTNRWTPFSQISPFLSAAVLTTEDGKFEYHKGLTLPEIRAAFLRNWEKAGLLHGGSTITMQLAKNLFLSRDRTVARKLQELFFVWYLESNFTKQEILELYFNVIEFGPSIYGIGEASMHYFGREPSELNLLESVFLIKLLPNPVSRHRVWENGDTLGERKLKSLHRVLDIMRKRKRITEAEYNEGLREKIAFYKEHMPLPEPRLPVQRSWAGGGDSFEEDDEAPLPEDDGTAENW
ncbi:MAG: penicillin-binding protein [Deltaproteobacteria bacterium]|nr:penicillin-binding protein [Deltaproteobacteria bacterium]